MLNPRDLLGGPVTYDLIISDFGREAAIEYLHLAARYEKQLIDSILRVGGYRFFDEYRRMMFTLIGDVAFFKEAMIADSTSRDGFLSETILVGVGFSPASRDFIKRVTISIAQEALAALGRGHQRLRVAIPCNGLSYLAKEVVRIINSDVELRLLLEESNSGIQPNQIRLPPISVHTVPEAVVHHLAGIQQAGENIYLLVLGTRGAHAQYELLTNSTTINVLPIADHEFELLNRSIVAAIGGDPEEVTRSREQIRVELIEPRKRLFNNLVVLEACTDFRLGLGLNSLDLFAQAMVADCYRFVSSTETRMLRNGEA
jgi:hypothetical protein